jgi:hypothetical protein
MTSTQLEPYQLTLTMVAIASPVMPRTEAPADSFFQLCHCRKLAKRPVSQDRMYRRGVLEWICRFAKGTLISLVSADSELELFGRISIAC